MKTKLITLIIAPLVVCAAIFSCSQPAAAPSGPDKTTLARMDSLEKEIKNITPSVSDYMQSIEQHHAKLWFAGKNENWELASYQMDKLKELFGKIKTNYAGTADAQALPMIFPALDDMTSAIESKNEKTFEDSYNTLTSTCNNCHFAVNFSYNVITVPSAPPVPDQDFKKADQ